MVFTAQDAKGSLVGEYVLASENCWSVRLGPIISAAGWAEAPANLQLLFTFFGFAFVHDKLRLWVGRKFSISPPLHVGLIELNLSKLRQPLT
jgi:hypothetical protein